MKNQNKQDLLVEMYSEKLSDILRLSTCEFYKTMFSDDSAVPRNLLISVTISSHITSMANCMHVMAYDDKKIIEDMDRFVEKLSKFLVENLPNARIL